MYSLINYSEGVSKGPCTRVGGLGLETDLNPTSVCGLKLLVYVALSYWFRTRKGSNPFLLNPKHEKGYKRKI
jgi:hypothetical protein